MASVLPVLIVVLLGLLITRVATVMLIHTGMSTESAKFQARSAFLGVGYTTDEAESVVSDPARRRIVMSLMWLGNAGIVTGVGTLIFTFGADEGRGWEKAAALVAGLFLLLLLARSDWVDRRLTGVIEWVISRWTSLDVHDYASLLHLREDFRVYEMEVRDGDWVAGRTLGELALREEGIAVLGIERGDGYVGTPHRENDVRVGDVLILYGPRERLCELDERPRGPAGDAAHARAVEEAAAPVEAT